MKEKETYSQKDSVARFFTSGFSLTILVGPVAHCKFFFNLRTVNNSIYATLHGVNDTGFQSYPIISAVTLR